MGLEDSENGPIISEEDYLRQQGVLAHYGTPRKSGRYPWGSGDDETGGSTQRNTTLLAEIDRIKQEHGYNDTQAAQAMGITTTQLRDIRTIVRSERTQDKIHMARKLKEKGLSNGAIAIRLREAGFQVSGESHVRGLLKGTQERKAKVLDNITDSLRKAVDEKGFLDVGSGVEFQLSVTSTKLRSALRRLELEGYVVHPVKIDQAGTSHMTNYKVLCKPDTTWAQAQQNRFNIRQLTDYSDDGGLTVLGLRPPMSLSSKRVAVKYAKDGGTENDGVMYVRDGPSDLSLGKDRYSQVRVLVDDTHYLKGMAIKVDGSMLPKGVDVLFHTNKDDTGDIHDAMKKIKDDPDNPFGATVKQIGERDHSGKLTKVTSVMNKVNSEGDWDNWSRSLSSQVLSKQKPSLAKEQLDLAYQKKQAEYQRIQELTNPSVKKKLLEAFADSADSSAVHLKAAALPNQKTQVILPVNGMKPNEVYAPHFKDGERVALIRFPHGGTFEIPELVVNNRNPAARKLLGDSKDAIGIHSKVAERLSGADFDGDSVLVIPNNQGRIKSTPALEGLRNFEPKTMYPKYPGMKVMTAYEKGMQMGLVSNLITDMTIKGANTDELAQAVRHSMVVIDAEKHELDFRRSAQDNGIAALMKKYQTSSQGGASTLVSRANSPIKVDERKPRPAAKGGPIDPKTGRKIYEDTGRTKSWKDADGNVHTVRVKQESTKLAEASDAHVLSSGTVVEKIYADHSNRLKALANQARKDLIKIKPRPYSPSAKEAYRSHVDTLNAKLRVALENAPLERQAQVFANATIRLKIQANPALKLQDHKEELRRIKSQALSAARARTGADKLKFEITDGEWAAIQAGAITAHKLDQILGYANLDQVKELATPHVKVTMTPTNVNKAKALHARGYSWADIAATLGVSTSTVVDAVGSEGGD